MKTDRRITRWTLGVVGLALLALGCGGTDGGPADTAGTGGNAAAAPPTVALVMKSLANEFFVTMEDGARKHHAEHDAEYDLICQGIQNELDVNRQIQIVEQMAAQGVDAIVIAPADSKALVSACKRAMDAGIVVVNIDNKFDDDVLADKEVRIPFVGPDNRKGARMVGEYLAKHLDAGAQVALIGGVPSAFNAIQRKQGFEDAMEAAGITIAASQAADWEMAKANNVVSALMSEHPGLDAILCANDSMALGAVAALKDAGKLEDVEVVGYDNISAVQDLVKEGTILATADQHADQLAVYGIEYALEMLGGGQAPEDRETPVHLVTAETLN